MTTSATRNREIVISRVIAAPRELVWDAFTDPEQVVQWWGPRGFTTTTREMRVAPGGIWRFVMHGPDGVDYENRIEFTDIVKPERLAYCHAGEGEADDVQFSTVVTFEAHPTGTEVTLRMEFASADGRARVIDKYDAVEGGLQHIARLVRHVTSDPGHGDFTRALPSERQICFRRVFDAPRDLVFQALTTPAMISQWLLGPPGWTMPVCEVDLRVGGAYRFVWRNADGVEMGVRGVCKELVHRECISWTEAFDDSWYPGEALITHTLADVDGATELTLTLQYESGDARDAVLQSPMDVGLNASFGRLDELLVARESR